MNSYEIQDSKFPAGFLWGAATSAYQVEGAVNSGGRGPSVWDSFCEREGAVRHRDTGEFACDHLNRFEEDITLMEQIGLRAYRFSISWPRILPQGQGSVNEPGLGFYDAVVDRLLQANIQPWVTLFHWDYPQSLYDEGGWLNPESPSWFADYTRVVVERLSDRVQHWFTINEPQCFIRFGHGEATNAPGVKLSIADQLTATHNVLLSHGRCVQTIREVAKSKPMVGWAPVAVVKSPITTEQPDIDAAMQAMRAVPSDMLWNNTWFNDPVFFGTYPDEGLQAFGPHVPKFSAKDMQTINQPIDFLGLNIYSADRTETDGSGGWREVPHPLGVPRTSFDWPVVEDCLYWGLRFHDERYDTPLLITENGMANVDWVTIDGQVHDPQRIDYTHRHLLWLRQAIAEGIDVRGYFHWSLLDNFEWGEGYGKRFGLVHVDFHTQKRTLKDSASWYRRVIQSNGAVLDENEAN